MQYLARLISFFILLPFSAVVFSVQENTEERRLALVMGNSQYDGLDDLPNVRNDTSLISSKLKTLGFETKVVLNASRKEMLLSIRKFGEQLDDNDVGLFYYAGHAVQQGSLNYMIPSKNSSEIDKSTLEFDAVDLNRVVAQMRDAESNINIIILDACRDNPFKSTSRTRGLGQTKGLAAPTVNVRGMYIAYSTSPGSVAADGDYDNSPYTKALANYIDQPGLGINEMFTKVRSDVIEQTDNDQVPWEMSSLTADFYFSNEQTEEEKSNELKIEAEMARLKEMLQQERQAKAEAEGERQKAEGERREALARLKENQDNLALERSLIEQQKLTELDQLRDAQLAKERLRNEAEKAFESEKKLKQKAITVAKRKQLKEIAVAKREQEKAIAVAKREQKKEIAVAKREHLKLEKAEKKRLTVVAKAKSVELQKRRNAKAKQESIVRNEEKARRRGELAELRKIEELQIAEQEKLARLKAAKEHQAEQRAKNLEDAHRKQQLALRKAELRDSRIAKAEAKEAKLAENRLAKLVARQQAAIQDAERIEAKRLKDKRAKELKLAAELEAKELKLVAELAAKELKLAAELAAQEQKLAAKELKLAARLAAQEQKRLKRVQAAQLAQQKLQEKEAKRLAKLAIEEEQRIAREKQLVISMANNCDRLLSNSSSGRKVLSCYRDVLAQDQNNVQAATGMLKLEKLYQAKISESLTQGKLNRVNREFAVLESINPVVSKKMFGPSVQSLQEKARKLSEESARKVLPTF